MQYIEDRNLNLGIGSEDGNDKQVITRISCGCVATGPGLFDRTVMRCPTPGSQLIIGNPMAGQNHFIVFCSNIPHVSPGL